MLETLSLELKELEDAIIVFSTYPASTGRQVCTAPSHHLAKTGRGKRSQHYFVAFLKLKSMGSCTTPLLPGLDGRVEAIVAFSHSWPETGTHPQTRHSPTALQKHMQVPHSQDIFSLLF